LPATGGCIAEAQVADHRAAGRYAATQIQLDGHQRIIESTYATLRAHGLTEPDRALCTHAHPRSRAQGRQGSTREGKM
jgi:hypothetical protein